MAQEPAEPVASGVVLPDAVPGVPPDVVAQVEELRAEILEHDRRYYVDAAPTVTTVGRPAWSTFASPSVPTVWSLDS